MRQTTALERSRYIERDVGLSLNQLDPIAPSYLAEQIRHRHGGCVVYIRVRSNGRFGVIREVRQDPFEMLIHFEDNGDLVWMGSDELRVNPGDGLEPYYKLKVVPSGY